MTNEELVATLDQRFAKIDKRFDELGKDFRHEIRILGEDFRSNFGALDDGIKAVDEKLEHFQKENAKEHEDLSHRLLLVETRRR